MKSQCITKHLYLDDITGISMWRYIPVYQEEQGKKGKREQKYQQTKVIRKPCKVAREFTFYHESQIKQEPNLTCHKLAFTRLAEWIYFIEKKSWYYKSTSSLKKVNEPMVHPHLQLFPRGPCRPNVSITFDILER